jgi:hypothetical protein
MQAPACHVYICVHYTYIHICGRHVISYARLVSRAVMSEIRGVVAKGSLHAYVELG